MRRLFLAAVPGVIFSGVLAAEGRAQVPGAPPPVPAQLVMIFTSSPQEFTTLTLDKKPVGILDGEQDFAYLRAVTGGKHELALSATGAEDGKLEFSMNPKDVILVVAALRPNPGSSQHPKSISLQSTPIKIPEPDQTAQVFAFVPPWGKTTTGILTHGNEKGVSVRMEPGKLTSLGQGKTSVVIGQKPVIFVNPSGAGVFVSVLLEGMQGGIHAVPFSFEPMQPEETPPAKNTK